MLDPTQAVLCGAALALALLSRAAPGILEATLAAILAGAALALGLSA